MIVLWWLYVKDIVVLLPIIAIQLDFGSSETYFSFAVHCMNHPMLIVIKKIASALATTNCVIGKPSQSAPCSVLEFDCIFKR